MTRCCRQKWRGEGPRGGAAERAVEPARAGPGGGGPVRGAVSHRGWQDRPRLRFHPASGVDAAEDRPSARAFDRRTGPSGAARSLSSAGSCWLHLRTFATHLAVLPDPPRQVADLGPQHLHGYRLRHANKGDLAKRIGGLIQALR
jgi:hypothetical protein